MNDTFITDYLSLISNCKTERECVKYAKDILEEAGFKADTSTSNKQYSQKTYSSSVHKKDNNLD